MHSFNLCFTFVGIRSTVILWLCLFLSISPQVMVSNCFNFSTISISLSFDEMLNHPQSPSISIIPNRHEGFRKRTELGEFWGAILGIFSDFGEFLCFGLFVNSVYYLKTAVIFTHRTVGNNLITSFAGRQSHARILPGILHVGQIRKPLRRFIPIIRNYTIYRFHLRIRQL